MIQTNQLLSGRTLREFKSVTPPRPISVAPDDVLPVVDFGDALRRAVSSAGSGGHHDDGDRVPFRAILLEQNLVVFVSGEEGATELVIDLDEETSKQVGRMPIGDIDPGMAVLVRSEGGGDFVVDAANRILGSDVDELRDVQRDWKRLLQNIVFSNGMSRTIKLLRGAGSAIATEQNVRNWMSFRQIRTQNQTDFDAIFSVIGTPETAQEVWQMMGRISHAHHRAGALIRKQLLAEVATANLTSLVRDGKQEFALPGDIGGGVVVAHRVVSVSPELMEMHPSSLHRVIELGD